MKPDARFINETPEFWSNIKFLNQKIGYHRKPNKKNPSGGFVIPTVDQIKSAFSKEGLNFSKLVNEKDQLTKYGQKIIEYFKFRRDLLNKEVEPNLMNAAQAKELFLRHKANLKTSYEFPVNKQSGDKKDFAFLTSLVIMILEENKLEYGCDYDPRELTSITKNGYPIRTLSRRIDGAFPSAINPVAVWEIKEYYYTTSFGSRIADGVYETMLDGYELKEIRENLKLDIQHYLFIDAYSTWWNDGKSFLCRMVDILHMGLVTEIIVGKEVVSRIPELVKEWILLWEKRNKDGSAATDKPKSP